MRSSSSSVTKIRQFGVGGNVHNSSTIIQKSRGDNIAQVSSGRNSVSIVGKGNVVSINGKTYRSDEDIFIVNGKRIMKDDIEYPSEKLKADKFGEEMRELSNALSKVGINASDIFKDLK